MKRVVIIGAGPAGLTAGYKLLKEAPEEYEVTILEGSSAIGGISQTIRTGGNRMDIGGHRFFTKDKEVMDFWKTIMPIQGSPSKDNIILGKQQELCAGGPDPEKEDRVMLIRDRVSRIYYLKSFFDYPVSMKWQTFKNMGFSRTVKAGFSYLKSCIVKKDETSLENFYINRFGKTLYSMFFEKYTEKLWGRHPSEISADWGAQRVKGLSITAVISDMFKKAFHIKSKKVETSLIERFYYPKYGPGQLWEQTAADFEKMGGRLLMHHNVEKINVKDGKVLSVVCRTEEGDKTIEGDIFISSMPVKDLIADIAGDEAPQDIKAIAAGLPYRDFITAGLLVDRLNLKNTTNIKTLGNIVPDCWIYVQEPDVKMGRIQIFNNWSPYMVEDPEHTVWIGLEYFCNEGDNMWNMSDEEFVNFASGELVKMGIIDSGSVKASHRERVKKAYPAYFDTYAEMDKVVDYLNSVDNLYCVGRNGQHRYNNMDHSMATAFRAVEHIMGVGGVTREDIWKVNTDKEYHETQAEENAAAGGAA